jgi:hypothetical protein
MVKFTPQYSVTFGGITEEADTSKNTLIWLIATNNIKWIFREL